MSVLMNVVAVVCIATGSRGQAAEEQGAEQRGAEIGAEAPAKSAKTSAKTGAKSNSKASGSKGRGKGKGRKAASRGKQPAKMDEDNDVDNNGAGETAKAEGQNSSAVSCSLLPSIVRERPLLQTVHPEPSSVAQEAPRVEEAGPVMTPALRRANGPLTRARAQLDADSNVASTKNTDNSALCAYESEDEDISEEQEVEEMTSLDNIIVDLGSPARPSKGKGKGKRKAERDFEESPRAAKRVRSSRIV
ncbi:hypothetical protein C8Q74DRAFT_927661 [Fomes fomentarius]|nr:hypothetical protein C8Q74DRAFT_927661 [Fomes fomentarius]